MTSTSNGVVADDLVGRETGSVADLYDRAYSTWDAYWTAATQTRTVTPANVETMLRLDGKVRAVEQASTLPLRSVPYEIEGDDEPAVAVRHDLERLDPPFAQVLAELASATVHGRSTHELIYGERDGRVALERVAHRPPTSTTPRVNERTGQIEGFDQRVVRDLDMATVRISNLRSLVLLHNRHRRPLTGLSDLECAWHLFEHRQKVRFLYFDYLENHTLPKAVGKDSAGDPDSLRRFAQRLATLKGGGAIAIGPDQEVAPYESSGRGAGEYREALDQLGREIADSVLAGFLNLTAGTGGSYALSRDQSDLFLQSRQAVLAEQAAAIRTQVFAPLTHANFGGRAKVPTLTFAPLVHAHTAEAFTLLQSLASSDDQLPDGFTRRLGERVGSLLDLPAG